jgi:hypothetical protein
MKRVISASVPRSGHHFLVDLLTAYFDWGEFLHCEGYDYEHCCKTIPCTLVNERFAQAFGGLGAPKLFLQKTHDLDNEAAFDPASSYLVQVRDPGQAAIGWLRWVIAEHEPKAFFEVGHDLVGFLLYYVRFFHKWCHNAPRNQVVWYEDLTASPETLAETIRNIVQWSGLPADEERVQRAISQTMSIDAHTKGLRTFGTKQYDLSYYRHLSGAMLDYTLKWIVKLCPELKYGRGYGRSTASDAPSILDPLFVLLPLDTQSSVVIDYEEAAFRLRPATLETATGAPMFAGLGISAAERGTGAWTDGDVALFTLRVDDRAQCVSGRLTGWAIPELQLAQLSMYAVIEGEHRPVRLDVKRINGDVEIWFDMEVEDGSTNAPREGAFVVRFSNLHRNNPAEKRKLGILLKKLVVVSERLHHVPRPIAKTLP